MDDRILIADSNSTLRGGQAVFLQVVSAALPLFKKTTLLFPLGGDLEFRSRLRFGERVSMVSIPEMRLTRRRKGVWDILKLLWFTVGLLRHLRLLARHGVIYVNSGRLFLSFYLVSFLLPGKRFIYHIHHDHNRVEKRLIRLIAGRANTFRVIANSEFAYDRLCEAEPSLRNNQQVMLVENGLGREYADLPFHDRFTPRAGLALSVAVVGGIGPEKGQDVVVDLAPEFPDMTFYLIGGVEPGCEEYVEALKARAGSNVRWLGETTDLPEALRGCAAQVSLMPSRCLEAFGLVAIESMACSCVTLTSGLGGLQYIAAKTGAWIFADHQELREQLRALQALTPEAMRTIAMGQHQETLRNYHQDVFLRKIGGVLAAAAL